MSKGRKKLPNEVKALRGTDQPCRMTEQTGVNSITALPRSGLKGTAKKIFELVGTELLHKNLLELVSLDLVVAYSREMGLYHDMMREVEKEGILIEVEPTPKRVQSSLLELPNCEGGRRSQTKNGTATIINPKRKVAESALANAKAIAMEFGFTPASRSRVSGLLNVDAPKDDFAEFEELE